MEEMNERKNIFLSWFALVRRVLEIKAL